MTSAGRDDRMALGLMLLPVLVLAFALVSGKLIKPRLDALALPKSLTIRWPAALVRAPVGVVPPVVRPPIDIAYKPATLVIAPTSVALAQPLPATLGLPLIRREVSFAPAVRYVSLRPSLQPLLSVSRAITYPDRAPDGFGPAPLPAHDPLYAGAVGVRPDILAGARPVVVVLPAALAPPTVTVALPSPQLPDPALLLLPPALTAPPLAPDFAAPLPPQPIVPDAGTVITTEPQVAGGACRPARMAQIGAVSRPQAATPRRALDGAAFGLALAEAAEAQSGDLVFYTAEYKRIAYPLGDIPALHGSCSDVVIRAYRSLGIDLQEHVQRARVGSGDTNIDHRRTETLRKLFDRLGAALPISAYPEDYKPGDIVTYYRPHSRVSRAHVAIVSTQLAATGRPMIVHNRGWGAQLEDALFADEITGHYRLTGAMVPPEAEVTLIAGQTKPATRVAAAPRRVASHQGSVVNQRTDLTPGGKLASGRKIPN